MIHVLERVRPPSTNVVDMTLNYILIIICRQLNGFKHPYAKLTIEFNISRLFASS